MNKKYDYLIVGSGLFGQHLHIVPNKLENAA